MLQIEPIEKVITQRSLVVTMDEEEIAKILVDARPFQKALRQQKSAWYHNGAWQARETKTIHPKDVVKKAGTRGVKCPKCGKSFKALGRHLSVCMGNKDLFGAAERSPLDE